MGHTRPKSPGAWQAIGFTASIRSGPSRRGAALGRPPCRCCSLILRMQWQRARSFSRTSSASHSSAALTRPCGAAAGGSAAPTAAGRPMAPLCRPLGFSAAFAIRAPRCHRHLDRAAPNFGPIFGLVSALGPLQSALIASARQFRVYYNSPGVPHAQPTYCLFLYRQIGQCHTSRLYLDRAAYSGGSKKPPTGGPHGNTTSKTTRGGLRAQPTSRGREPP